MLRYFTSIGDIWTAKELTIPEHLRKVKLFSEGTALELRCGNVGSSLGWNVGSSLGWNNHCRIGSLSVGRVTPYEEHLTQQMTEALHWKTIVHTWLHTSGKWWAPRLLPWMGHLGSKKHPRQGPQLGLGTQFQRQNISQKVMSAEYQWAWRKKHFFNCILWVKKQGSLK